ncbi:MaoC family dehydratase N-terminal domain-containing protein [Rhodococcus sp. LB1]|uniref:MaoC family dehydratase N-terminal domain-containing protein n=1 Tax=Rhodococcus sp. LB1 TaxID=1807499 RepID=UPI00077AABF7|nr:MaoC family dehydratase N-terminal domain-containing protein [Rhodococcus sp. LB1]KXX59874.1 acyl dehydratase [Rhodococcus sp. LB1]
MASLDPGVIGTRIPEHTVEVERGRLSFFARATGQQDDPIYTDPSAAAEAGHRDLPVPPTFLFCLDMERPSPSTFYTDLGVDIRTILHGEQSFTYHATAYAGDTLHFSTEVTDCYAKKGGALQFLVRTTEVTRHGEPIAQLRSTTVIRDPRASA